jgi:hypothetical protein
MNTGANPNAPEAGLGEGVGSLVPEELSATSS